MPKKSAFFFFLTDFFFGAMAHADARSVTYNAPQGLNDSDLKRFFDVDYEKTCFSSIWIGLRA